MESTNSFADVAIFSWIDSKELEFLATRFVRRKFSKNQIIFHQDDPGDRLYVVDTGKVKISITSKDGQEGHIALLSPGDCFGEMSVLDGGCRSATAVALEDTTTMTLSREAFLEFLYTHPKAAVEIIYLLVQRLRKTDELVVDMFFFDVSTRVAKQLINLAEIYQPNSEQETPITISMTQEDLGKMVGAAREVVARELKNFRELGLLTTKKGKIIIQDLKELERIAAA